MNPQVFNFAIRAAGTCLLAIVGFAAGGCGGPGGKAIVMRDAAEFHSTVQSPDKPVLMMFFKQGCRLAALEPTIDRLAGEYEGRAVVAKIMVMYLDFVSPVPEIMNSHDVHIVPAVILFNHGQQVKRWDVNYNIDHYRQGLNDVLGTKSPPKSPPAKS